MNIIFFGTDDFAQAHLEAIIDSPHRVICVVAPPDKARGRGLKVSYGPVKELALKHALPVYQPENVNEEKSISFLKNLSADIFVVIAYGKILSKKILALPSAMPINVHSSLLPKYRGAAPINWAVINGDKVTGISIIKMNERMDAGDIVAQMDFLIEHKDTSVTLREKMKSKGPGFLLETLGKIEKGEITLRPQDPRTATFAPKLDKMLAKIDWQKPAHEIHNLIRGLQPWPYAYTNFKGKILRVLSSENSPVNPLSPAGSVCEIDKEGFSVATGKGVLRIRSVHLEGANPMEAKIFLMGHQLQKGFTFGK